MKNLSLFVSAFALCASTSYAAINCGTLPTCASLGYSDTVSQCPKSVNGEEMVIRCPFDAEKPDKEAKGKCIYEAAVGQIGYFTKAPNAASGWLLCDGKSYSYTKYPQLAKLIGTQFGGTVNNTFNVPDYRGFFLRVYAGGASSAYVRSDFATYAKGAVNNDFTKPQKEGLPNITGTFTSAMIKWRDEDYQKTSTFNYEVQIADNGDNPASFAIRGVDVGSGLASQGRVYSFNASRYNPLYGAQSGVTPPNMAVHAYIYAGKIVQ